MYISRLKEHRYFDVNRKYLELTGYSFEELINKSTLDLWVDLHDKEDMLREVYEVGCVENFEIKYRKKSGEIGLALFAANILKIDGEDYLLASVIDITERKKIEEALRLSEELFYKAFNTNPLPIAIISMEQGNFIEMNESFIKANDYAYTREQLLELNSIEIDAWVDINERNKYIARIRKEGYIKNFEVTLRLKSGKIKTVLLSGVAITWRGTECILSIINDITQLRHYQHEIVRLGQMNLIGEMSASIAHEIRNPMTTVKGFLQLFKSKDRYVEDMENINLMIEELDRANAIITEFLSLSKNNTIELKRGNLNEKIKRILPLVQADALKNDINIELKLEEIPDIMLDEAEIRQLILNIISNGFQAMLPGGRLNIKTYKENERVIMEIRDQGSGMTPEVLDKIGTPFFTTKENGTGLGLAVCYSIAHKHNATIEVETASAGTLFRVIFL